MLSLPKEKKKELIERSLRGERVTELCKQVGVSRKTFYVWLKKYHSVKPHLRHVALADRRYKKQFSFITLSEDQKRSLFSQKAAKYPSVAALARTWKVSRKTYYVWAKRYAAQGEKGLRNRRRTGASHPRATPQSIILKVLDFVSQNPDYSVHKLAKSLSFVGHHGIQTVLERYHLNSLEGRRLYAQKFAGFQKIVPRIHDAGRIAPLIEQLTPNVLPAPPPAVSISRSDLFPILLKYFRSHLRQLVRLPLTQTNPLVVALISFTIPVCLSLITHGVVSYLAIFFTAPSLAVGIGYLFASIALGLGMFFFLYSFKYYASVVLVLLFSRQTLTKEGEEIKAQRTGSSGLIPDISQVEIERHPFVSIHLPLFNEKRVVNRLLEAVTSMEYDNFEVIVADDSTDETKDIVLEWQNHPRIKISHRDTRQGFKGGALREALKLMDSRTEFVLVFDSDFLPYPDTITQFLKYFKATAGTLNFQKGERVKGKGGVEPSSSFTLHPSPSPIAAIQGYQWHVLNKSENWITRGVRSEYAGSYVVERSGAEIYGGLKQIAGSVYMIRADILKAYGWGDSITEDFELTLKLYADGYKVVYTPYIQAPSECVSTLKRLVRQRMRWAEGHSHNVKRLFWNLLLSNKTEKAEKFEFIYLSPYYLQSFFFLIGTLFWFLSETVFHVRLPFWTEVWGWSLVLTNMLSLPLMNVVGMFLEEAEEKDFLGILSFILLTYIVAPFQAYASVKGFLEKEEGPWFRTPKTGRITDIYKRGRFYRWLTGIFGQATPAVAKAQNFPDHHNYRKSLRLSLLTANNLAEGFPNRRRLRWVGKTALVLLLTTSLLLSKLIYEVPLVAASPGTQIKTVEYFITQYASATDITTGQGINGTTYSDANDISFTVNLPESGTLNVRHAYVEWTTKTGAQSVASGEMKFDRATCTGSRSNTTLTLGAATATSGEVYPLKYRMDVAAEITAGSNNYCFNAQLTGTSLVRNSDNAKLVISYEFDDTATTQLRMRKYFVTCGTGTTTPTSGTVDPNIAESGAAVTSAWVEYTGHFYSSASGDGSVSIDINSSNGSEINTNDTGVTSYDILVMRDVSANVNLDSNNTIDLDHTTQLIANKCAELVITYSLNPYAATPGLQGNTVVYAIGQNTGDIPATQTTIGAARQVVIPEASVTYDKVWVRYWFIGDAGDDVTPKVLTSRDATGTTGSAYTMPGITEQAGKYNLLFDITTYFSNTANFQSGDTVTVQAMESVAGDHANIGAELVISYRHDQTGAGLTGQKTVYWLVGQKATAGSSDQTGSFTTYLPETETRRSSAVVMDSPKGIISVAITDTVTAGSTTCNAASTDTTLTDFTGSGENVTQKMLDVTGINAMTDMAGEAVSFCLGVGSTINDTVGAVAYTTFTASIPTLPENIVPFLMLFVILPKAFQLVVSSRERRAWRVHLQRKEYRKMFRSLADPYRVLYTRLFRQGLHGVIIVRAK